MIRLHGYWRSGAAYRVRIALALKGIAYEQVNHDLRTGSHDDAAYRTINPQGLVPAIESDDGLVVTQSLAILEWLEEAYPEVALLPADRDGRAAVRGMAALIACDIHPLGNLRVLNALRGQFDADEQARKAWSARWNGAGFSALEALVERQGGRFAYGDGPTIADCCLVPQLYSAERFGVDLTPYSRLVAAGERARALPAVAAAHPSCQPDADPPT